MVKKRYISFVLSAFLIASTPASATGWTAWAKGNFQGSTEHPSSIKTQQGGVLSGGGVRVRWGNLGTIRPINITPPSFSVGCNGMDFSLGAISFMDFDEIVEKLKMVASAAPAFAFKMAIDTVCSQCATIMQDLEEIINMINNMSLDACKMAENIGNGVGAALGEAISSPGGNGHSDSYAAISDGIRTAAGYTSMVTGAINNLDDITIKSRFYGSFLEYVKEHSQNQTVKDFIPHLRAIVGDFGVVYKKKEMGIQNYPKSNLAAIEELFRAFLEPDGATPMRYVAVQNIYTDSNDVPEEIRYIVSVDTPSSSSSLGRLFYAELTSLLIKMRPGIYGGSKLSASDLTTIRALPKNGYKILNAIYVLNIASSPINGAQQAYLEKYAKYVALEYLASALQNSFAETLQTIADYSKSLTVTEHGKAAQAYMDFMISDINDAMKETNKIYEKWLKKYSDIDQNLYQKQLEQQIKNSLK